jgi:hypothetical protein
MLRAALRNKVTPWLGQHGDMSPPEAWRQIVHRNEDLLASSVLERLGYLSEARGMATLFGACTWTGDRAPASGPVLEAHAWPTPMVGDRREPDWVFVLPEVVVVVEAKWGDGNVPSRAQLEDQLEVVRARWPTHELVQVALVQSGPVEFPEGGLMGLARWDTLRLSVLKQLVGEVPAHERRVLQTILEVLDARNLSFRPAYLDSLPAIAVEFFAWT